MRHTPERLKVALVDLDGQPVPDWVRESLAREGIELIEHKQIANSEVGRWV